MQPQFALAAEQDHKLNLNGNGSLVFLIGNARGLRLTIFVTYEQEGREEQMTDQSIGRDFVLSIFNDSFPSAESNGSRTKSSPYFAKEHFHFYKRIFQKLSKLAVMKYFLSEMIRIALIFDDSIF